MLHLIASVRGVLAAPFHLRSRSSIMFSTDSWSMVGNWVEDRNEGGEEEGEEHRDDEPGRSPDSSLRRLALQLYEPPCRTLGGS